MPDPDPNKKLHGLDPGELLARSLDTVKPTGGASAWEPPTPEELAKLLPQYRIESLLGRGGMGAVYSGVQAALERPVAIKLLPAELAGDGDFLVRFQREARTLAKLQHPGIVTVYDFGQTSVCDFDRFIIRTNFNGTVQETHEFNTAQIDDPINLRLLRAVFTDPAFLKPQRTTAEVTEKLATQIAEVAMSLQKRESRELADAKTRTQANYSQRKNLRIARFLNRVVFCFFAEDTGLLPKGLFSELTRTAADDPAHFAETLEKLFAVMAKGGTFGVHKIRHFNGHLFEDSSVFELTADELARLAEASEADWQFIQPSIMGTLFERALDESQRGQLGAHYTNETDIRTLVEPVLLAPLRREWSALKGELAAAFVKGKGTPAQREQLAAFQGKFAATTVLDPACGGGNFLYVSLQSLLGLEKEVVTYGAQLGFKLAPQVSVQQLRALEINPYAFELAQVSVQIGFLQWRRDNGFDNDRSPVLQNLDGFQNKDALMRDVFKTVPKDLKEAQAEEHAAIVPLGASQFEIVGTSAQGEFTESSTPPPKAGEERLRVYYERAWPDAEIIVGNPPFIGNKRLRSELGAEYTKALFKIYGDRLPSTSDFCCYWFEKARQLVAEGKCRRAGLLATTGSKQVSSRHAFERIKETGRIFFAISDRDCSTLERRYAFAWSDSVGQTRPTRQLSTATKLPRSTLTSQAASTLRPSFTSRPTKRCASWGLPKWATSTFHTSAPSRCSRRSIPTAGPTATWYARSAMEATSCKSTHAAGLWILASEPRWELPPFTRIHFST